jgi:methionyl-tRNA synthetase
MPKPFFITTAIDYTNGAPHIGHAYEKVLGDVLARYHRLKGEDVFLMTGVDQHGQKVQQSAEKEGVAPQVFVDGITAKFLALWEKLDVRYDAWAATTDATHKDCVRAILQKLWDDKDPATGASRWIYKKTERGWYSVRQEQFSTDKDAEPMGNSDPSGGRSRSATRKIFTSGYSVTNNGCSISSMPGAAKKKPFVIPDFRVAELRNSVEKWRRPLHFASNVASQVGYPLSGKLRRGICNVRMVSTRW